MYDFDLQLVLCPEVPLANHQHEASIAFRFDHTVFPGFEFLRRRRYPERRQQTWPHEATTESHHGCSGSHWFMIVGEKFECEHYTRSGCMGQRVATVAFEGIEARTVDVQVQVAPGLPIFSIVGLPESPMAKNAYTRHSSLAVSHCLPDALPSAAG